MGFVWLGLGRLINQLSSLIKNMANLYNRLSLTVHNNITLNINKKGTYALVQLLNLTESLPQPPLILQVLFSSVKVFYKGL